MQTRNPSDSHPPLSLYDFCGLMQEVLLENITPYSIERVSIDCRKTKNKVITLANQKGRRQSSKPIKTRSNYT